MAEVVELFPYLNEEEEEEEAAATAEEGEEEEEEDESLYWSSACFPVHFDPAFTSSRRSSSSDSEESAIAAFDCSDYHIPLPHDFSDHTPPSPLFDPFPETLDSHDFSVLDSVHDFLDDGELEVRNSPIGGLRIVGFGSESDSSEEDGVIDAADCDTGSIVPDRAPDDLGRHLSWGFIPIDDDARRSSGGEEFEWEEVDDRLDDRGVLSMMIGIDDDDDDEEEEEEETSSGRGEVVDVQIEPEGAGGEVEEDELNELIESGSNIVWEVLMAMNNHGMARSNSRATIEHFGDVPYFEDDQEVFVNPSDYEFQIGLLDHDNIIRGSPPAAKLVVDALPLIVLTGEDVANNNCLCAICKDAFLLEEKANQLPCLHLYHNDCILPWLGIRNTCPVCRYELPTDDPEYESLKGRT